jgi:polyhydroxyalkanoate synthesis regulator phasin
MFDNKSVTKKQLLKMLEQLKKNPKDKIGILGDVGITVLGAIGAGGAVAAAGTTVSIPIITALTGIGMVVAAPVGMVAGAAVAGGAVAYGVSRLIKSGGFNEGKQKQLLNECEKRLRDIEAKERASSLEDNDKTRFHIFLEEPLKLDLISAEDAQGLIMAVENGQMSLHDAYHYVEDVIKAAKPSDSKQDSTPKLPPSSTNS